VAFILGEPIPTIDAIFSELQSLGMIEGQAVCAWQRRQFESDNSTERSRKHRETKRNASATLQQRDATPPESETDTEKNTHTSERAREADFRQAIATEYKRQGHIPPDTGRAITWLGHGWNPEICVAAVADGLRKKNKFLPLSYFDGAIADAHAKPPAGQARAGPVAKPSNPYAARLAQLSGIGQSNEPSFPGTTIDADSECFGHTARTLVALG
jgi:hypothetical protein